MTAYGTTQTAIEAMKLGAYDYLLKPFDAVKIKELVSNALKAARDMKQVVSYEPMLESEDYDLGIVGRSEVMQQVFKLIGQGYEINEIAKTLNVNHKTIHTYCTRIKEKLKLDSSAELLREALRWTEIRAPV